MSALSTLKRRNSAVESSRLVSLSVNLLATKLGMSLHITRKELTNILITQAGRCVHPHRTATASGSVEPHAHIGWRLQCTSKCIMMHRAWVNRRWGRHQSDTQIQSLQDVPQGADAHGRCQQAMKGGYRLVQHLALSAVQ